MAFLSSFPEKYVGKSFEIDCVDVEINCFDDHKPPIFKGPGVIRGDQAGRFSYKIYNQISVNQEIFNYLKNVRESNDPQKVNLRLFAKAYDGTEWIGGWSIPNFDDFSGQPYILLHGEIDSLSTRIKKMNGDQTKDSTELIFADNIELPLSGTVKIQHLHKEEVIRTSWKGDHQNVNVEGIPIIFQKSFNEYRLHVIAEHGEKFTPPFIENWITEALIFVTARVIQPRMVIRHFSDDALVFLRATPKDTRSQIPSVLSLVSNDTEAFWLIFTAYLSKCKLEQRFEFLDITRGFYELCLVSKGTLQGFLTSLSVYIEFCVDQIFPSKKSTDEHKEKVKMLIDFVGTWECDDGIRSRAKSILAMLNKPAISGRLDILIRQSVITSDHKKSWNNTRHFLAHGNIIDFSREVEFWQYRNYLISMMYRLMLRIIGHKGQTLDYDGEGQVQICV